MGLGVFQGKGNILDFAALKKSIGLSLCYKGYLVSQVSKRVVDGCGRQHEHFSFDAGADDFLHQPLCPVHLQRAIFPCFFQGVATEVVGFVNDNEIVRAPVEVAEVNTVGVGTATYSCQISMEKDGIAEAVF